MAAIVGSPVTNTGTTAPSVGVLIPSVVSGNWIAIVAQQMSSSSRGLSLSGGSLQESVNIGATNQIKVWYFQELGATGDKTYTVTVDSSLTDTFRVTGYQVSGVDSVTPVFDSGQNTEATSLSHAIFSASKTIPAGGVAIMAAQTQAVASWGTLTFSGVTIDVNTTLAGGSQCVASYNPGTQQTGYAGAYSVTVTRPTYSAGIIFNPAASTTYTPPNFTTSYIEDNEQCPAFTM